MTILIPAWVDGELTPVEKLRVHREGLRHKAVSIFVNHGAATLIQQRAAGKYHTPGRWANACCTHPAWGETPEACARRRLREELGIDADAVRHRGRVTYRADVGGGLTEHEVVEIFTLDVADRVQPDPDPAEVGDTRWIGWDALEREIAAQPEAFVPWLRIYLADHRHLLSA